MENVITELEEAKRNVTWLLDHATGLVDMHGLAYWASRVVSLRDKLREI